MKSNFNSNEIFSELYELHCVCFCFYHFSVALPHLTKSKGIKETLSSIEKRNRRVAITNVYFCRMLSVNYQGNRLSLTIFISGSVSFNLFHPNQCKVKTWCVYKLTK